MTVVLVVVVLWIVIETIALVKQLQREQRLEEIVNKSLGKLDQLQEILEESGSILNENPRLKEAFAHDDEVGEYFKKVVEMQEILEETIIGDEEKELLWKRD